MSEPNPELQTRPTLLLRLRDPADESAWRSFVDVYTPLIYGYCRKQGLQDADAVAATEAALRATPDSADVGPDLQALRELPEFKGLVARLGAPKQIDSHLTLCGRRSTPSIR